MADWEEVRRLAADFQRVQLSATKQKLSDRNVIELVTRLVDLKLIDVLYTSDGKTYLTHQQLAKEIRDELIVHHGRVSLVDLQQLLNVDYSHIEAKVNDMVKHDGHLTLVLGQLIDNSYRQLLAQEINDQLQEKGHVTIIDLAKSYDLPADFLREVIDQYLGTLIKGQVDNYDKDVVFTDGFVSRMKAQIKGAFTAVTIPTTVGPIRQFIGCQEHLFFKILEELIASGRLAGSVSGSRQDKSQYLPDIYTQAQSQWVDSFYKQNGYLEYDTLIRLGIPDPKSYIKKKFKSEPLVFLSSCCVGPVISEQVQYSVDETLGQGGWLDIMTVLPSVLSRKDASELLSGCLKNKSQAVVCDSTIVASESLVSDSTSVFSDLMSEKAEKASKSHPAVASSTAVGASGDKPAHVKMAGVDDGSSAREDKKEQRRKKAATAGSTKKEGTGGREVKMKSTKKKTRNRDHDEGSDDEVTTTSTSDKGKGQESHFMSTQEIEKVLKSQDRLKDCPQELISEIASRLHRPLTRQYQEVAKSIFLKNSGTDRKKTALEIQDRINGLWVNARLFEKGIQLWEDPVHSQLVKHLLKTLGNDLANAVVVALAMDHMVSVSVTEEQLTPDTRLRLITTLPKDIQEQLTKLHVSLNGQSLEDFFHQLELLCGPAHLGILLKKPDKRKERQLVFNHRQSLIEQLKDETDPAMCLHLTAVLLFQTVTQTMLHIPGRLVPNVVQYLSSHLDADKVAVLAEMQDLIVKHAKLKASSEDDHEAEIATIASAMADLMDKVKEIAVTSKKSNTTSDD
ncbi:unnamed protein product [Candidula unifasciata]|uniref:E3 UFM1-protein ligase 1 homolog n=1 Tax=Candidula unifasciata TaxID=100452 RepID=A0A8S4A3L8_9EUPU|nr:unnamed protein product [Candidula unifasciata]